MNPAFAKAVDDEYGPLDWRLPEAHAIYWGARGLEAAKENPDKVNADDLIKLRRIIYQSLLQAFHHGRVISDPFNHRTALGPNLDLIPQVNKAYLQMYDEETDPGQKSGILRAQRNFLRDAIYFLYENNRMTEANQWFKYLGEKFPGQPIIENQPNSLPKNLTLDEYAVAVVQIDIGETSQERVTSARARAADPRLLRPRPSARTTATKISSGSPTTSIRTTPPRLPSSGATSASRCRLMKP